jgi:hypothetical protein
MEVSMKKFLLSAIMLAGLFFDTQADTATIVLDSAKVKKFDAFVASTTPMTPYLSDSVIFERAKPKTVYSWDGFLPTYHTVDKALIGPQALTKEHAIWKIIPIKKKIAFSIIIMVLLIFISSCLVTVGGISDNDKLQKIALGIIAIATIIATTIFVSTTSTIPAIAGILFGIVLLAAEFVLWCAMGSKNGWGELETVFAINTLASIGSICYTTHSWYPELMVSLTALSLVSGLIGVHYMIIRQNGSK